jgi:hypothetical protein
MCCATGLFFRHAVIQRAFTGDVRARLAGMRRLYQATLVMFWLAVGLPGMGVK